MTIDWKFLDAKTTQYTCLSIVTDPVSNLVDATFCGLHTELSTICNKLPSKGVNSIAIFCDTLEIDINIVKTTGLIIMARQLNVTDLKGQAFIIDMSETGSGVVQLMLGAAKGETFTFTSTGGKSPVLTPPIGIDPVSANVYEQKDKNSSIKLVPSGGILSVQDLVNKPWAMNSFFSSFTAGSWLMEYSEKSKRDTACTIFNWIVSCVGSLAQNNSQMPSDFAKLYNQAVALLITMNSTPGAIFVPILSSEFYSEQMGALIDTLSDYEKQISFLETQGDISKAVSTIVAGLEKTASIETTPLKVQLNNVNENILSLTSDIHDLAFQFSLQTSVAHTSYETMETYMELAIIAKTLSIEFDLAMNAIHLGFNAIGIYEGKLSDLKSAIDESVKTINNVIKLIKTSQSGVNKNDLTQTAETLLTEQLALLGNALNGAILLSQSTNDKSSGQGLPSNPASITIDPVTSWNNYLVKAEVEINVLRQKAKDHSSALKAVETYYANLRILVNYGKAISGKCLAFVTQLVQATVINAQIKAAKDIEKNWKSIEEKATSEEEKLAVLKGLLQDRADSIKRSVFVAWNYYKASYFYLNFTHPQPALNMDMSAAHFKMALANVAEWVAAALGKSTDGTHINLPSENAQISFTFDILKSEASDSKDTDYAILTNNKDGNWELNWFIPIGTDQLKGVLPNKGNCAIWISEAQYFLEGVTPNNKGNVITTVSTSGTYENGFGPRNEYIFATKGLTGNYCYNISNPQKPDIYSPWQLNTSIYMTPTPYSQWTMTIDQKDAGDPSNATKLKITMKIAYLTNS